MLPAGSFLFCCCFEENQIKIRDGGPIEGFPNAARAAQARQPEYSTGVAQQQWQADSTATPHTAPPARMGRANSNPAGRHTYTHTRARRLV